MMGTKVEEGADLLIQFDCEKFTFYYENQKA